MNDWSRRRFLRGAMHGSAIAVGVPLLDMFLDGNGQALAAGAPIPVRYGTWFWGCGINQARFFPDKVGAGYDLKEELSPIGPWKDKVTVFSGFNVALGGKPNLPHWSGIMGTLTGTTPSRGGMDGGATEAPTLDTLVADAIGTRSRFKSMEIACTGNRGVSYSMRTGSTVNPSEVDPVALYQRLFGPEFKDPNAAAFTPDPDILLRKSVLSSIKEDRDALLRRVGMEDRARMDQYFTSVREMEQQLGHLLQKPDPLQACVVAQEPDAAELGPTWEVATKTHDLMVQLAVMALACDQTRVFNIALSRAASNLRRSGEAVAFHELTHEEPIDEKLGYQPKSTFFMERSMEAFATLLKTMDEIKEGDGTLLDHSLVFATSESNYAKLHTLDSMPMLVAGSANGKWKQGQHVIGKGDPTSRVGLTIQQVLGMPVSTWGTGPMQATRPVSEVIA